jgi:hypothetical protein
MEFSVGCIGDATSDLTLVLPRGRYEEPILVTHASSAPHAVFLCGQHEFSGFECRGNSAWKGILIPNVAIEIDQDSIFEAEHMHASAGTLIRQDTHLYMITRDDSGFRRTIKTPLIADLPPSRENMAAGFRKWQIVVGEGTMKRELKSIEVSL